MLLSDVLRHEGVPNHSLSRRKGGLLHGKMINLFFSHGNGWDFGATDVNLLALSTLALAYRFQSRGAFLSDIRGTTLNFYRLTQ
jgi:hypothetical protein